MSTSATTGFCRVTVVAPDSRVDVALPEDLPVADVHPEILRLTGGTQPVGTPTGYHLVRRDGTVLDGARTLAAQRVLDGEILTLRPFAESLPPAVHDDVADAVAAAVTGDRALWNTRMLRAAGLTGAALLLVLLGLVLWNADPARHDAHGLPGIVAGAVAALLTAYAGVRARVYRDRGSAVALGLAAVPHLLIAGSGVIGPAAGEGAGRLQFLLGCATVLIASVVLVAVTPGGDAPFVATVVTSATGVLATFGMILTGAAPSAAAAVCAVAAIGALAFLPGLSARAARLPIGYAAPHGTGDDLDAPRAGADTAPVDAERVAARARRGHELLLGLVGGCSAVVVASAAVLAFAANPWAPALALTAGLAMTLRARLFRYTSQVATVLGAGLAALALLVLGLALRPHPGGHGGASDIRTVWLTVAVAAVAALLTAIALIIPRKGLSPFWGRASDIVESVFLLALVPLCLAVLDVYATARGLAGS